ncbi:MAG: SDR family oxidoreductase [Candidatus Hydrogenedentota bacterium]
MKRLWVTGCGGFVGSHVVRLADASFEVHGISRRAFPAVRKDAHYHVLDLTSELAVAALFTARAPDVVIHCAAYADIDFCQRNRTEAEAVNVTLVERLTDHCREQGARLIHCSTDNVFDGRSGPCSETDGPSPVNFYGETKVRAEQIVSKLPNHVIARVALVMGIPALSAGNSFLAKLIANAKTGAPTPFPENEVRSPIDVVTLALALLELADRAETGIIHLAGNSRLNRYEMGLQLAAELGISSELIRPIDSNAMEGRAPRPINVSLDNSKARSLLTTPMRNLAEGLRLVRQHKES